MPRTTSSATSAGARCASLVVPTYLPLTPPPTLAARPAGVARAGGGAGPVRAWPRPPRPPPPPPARPPPCALPREGRRTNAPPLAGKRLARGPPDPPPPAGNYIGTPLLSPPPQT